MAKVAAEVGATANQYQILGKLAHGGMAEIFLARGASVAGVERYCVLKRILRERATDALMMQMFVDEVRLAVQLQHPNIASVYDIGLLGDAYFFTMEYVHGETVRAVLQRASEIERPIPLACVLTIVAGAAAGLQHAHERKSNDGRPLGIVHRDVSPSNLMVSFEGHIKVVDFGVAKAADRGSETASGTVKGKISYLSPEQCRGLPVDRRSDLFSLGIVTWELLTGTRLFRRASDFETMTAIVGQDAPAPSSLRPEVPRAVDELVRRLLARSVKDRFQTAAEVIEAIEHASLRAGTILSSSAVARLIRDLFGLRPEPWLELADEPDISIATLSDPDGQLITLSGSEEVPSHTTAQVALGAITLLDPPRPPPGLPIAPIVMSTPSPAAAITIALSPRALSAAVLAPRPGVPFAKPSVPTLLAVSAPPPAPASGPYASTIRISPGTEVSRVSTSALTLSHDARRRIPWTLIAVITVAATLGIVLAWLFAKNN